MIPDLYIANKNYSSWSLRPWVLMRQLQIPFNERLMPFAGSETQAIYRTFSPSGKVPCLLHDDIVVWDSMAIFEYLADIHPQVWPALAPARIWARCASAEMHAGFASLRNICTMNCGLRVRMSAMEPGLLADIDRIDALWNQGIECFGGPFLAGDQFTAVDAAFAPVAFRVQTYNLPMSAVALEYVDQLLELAPMRDWYEAALLEDWRDEIHEQEAREAGPWLEDLRA
ncbi:glutathione S-transferase family protein [Halopseudomonas sp.]|uniref:glutathione S-transferase family protein n=1 Tax=Halopseudomonas sp. TaxID=2901191 RepID=UPI0035691418